MASVLKAINTLEKLGYVESKKIISQKNVEIKIYNCTDLGVFYALVKNTNADIPKNS